ncbi:MAG: NAD(P)-dependent oxidoreductase [Gemmatimonadetes bacterium]|nr:NAD(P)-dependent oxidoreductase [Gemmatimonadota bacterium]
MKAFVTGGTGFVGSHLVGALLARGDEVVCLVRDPRKAAGIFTGSRAPKVVRGDLGDAGALREGAGGADVVFHVAGLIAARNRDEFFRANGEGTAAVAAAAREAAPGLARLVYVSSLAASGPSRRGEPLTEDAPPHPVTSYGASKLAGEETLRATDLPWTVVRPPVVYGPRDRELLRIFRIVRFGVAPVFGDGTQENSFVFVEDLVEALLRAATAPARTTYFAAHPRAVTTRELVAGVYRAVRGTGSGEPLVVPIPPLVAKGALWVTATAASLAGSATLLSPEKAREFFAEAWVCSPAALERDTGWWARVSLAEGLARTAAWYRQAGWL